MAVDKESYENVMEAIDTKIDELKRQLQSYQQRRRYLQEKYQGSLTPKVNKMEENEQKTRITHFDELWEI